MELSEAIARSSSLFFAYKSLKEVQFVVDAMSFEDYDCCSTLKLGRLVSTVTCAILLRDEVVSCSRLGGCMERLLGAVQLPLV